MCSMSTEDNGLFRWAVTPRKHFHLASITHMSYTRTIRCWWVESTMLHSPIMFSFENNLCMFTISDCHRQSLRVVLHVFNKINQQSTVTLANLWECHASRVVTQNDTNLSLRMMLVMKYMSITCYDIYVKILSQSKCCKCVKKNRSKTCRIVHVKQMSHRSRQKHFTKFILKHFKLYL